MGELKLAVVPGDGIGPEVVDASLAVLEQVSSTHGLSVSTTRVELGSNRYLESGELWTEGTRAELARHDAIFFGALGDPRVTPGILERGVILKMRADFRQAVNFRPVRLYPGTTSPVRAVTPEACDVIIVRENSEGSYIAEGMTAHSGRERVAIQESVNTYPAIQRVVDFSFRLAAKRRRRLTLCHKTNILIAAGSLWQDVVADVGQEYPDVEVDYVNVDAFCALLPSQPQRFDVVVTDNLFGDIITDLGAFLQGGMGLAASANLNLDGTAPSMFEPVHGSAPDIAGTGRANPVAAMLSLALCLASVGEAPAGLAVESAVAAVLADSEADPEFLGATNGVTQAVLNKLTQGASPHTLRSSALEPLAAVICDLAEV